MKNGAYGELRSTVPPMTIPAWPSMFSGMGPGKLGTIDFKRKEGNHFRLNTSKDWKGRVLWDLMTDERFLVVNIPFTSPPYEINGDMICYDFAPSLQTYPPCLIKELKSRFFKSKKIRQENSLSKLEKIKIIYDREDMVFRIATYLLEKNDYDIAIVRFGIPDHISHISKEEKDIIDSILKLDGYVKKLMLHGNWDYLFLVSDHGIKKAENKFCINSWLYNHGYLSLTWKGRLVRYISSLLKPVLEKYNLDIGRFVDNIRTIRQKRLFDMPASEIILKSINFDKTVAFSIHSASLEYYPIYLLGASYSQVVKKLCADLLNFSFDGKRIIEKVWTREEIYHSGKNSLPDLIIKCIYPVLPILTSQKILNIESFTHSIDGIFLAYGSNIKKGLKINAEIYDVAPTILYIYRYYIPRDIEGRVLKEIFVDTSINSPIRYAASSDFREKEKKRLRQKIRRLKKEGFI